MSKVPKAALTTVKHFKKTDNTVQDDAEMLGHVVTRQLGVYDRPQADLVASDDLTLDVGDRT